MMNKVYFIGAGAGDPELITVKGKRIVEEADIVIYAGSLVNPEVLKWCKKDTEIYNSASMCLEEVMEVMIKGIKSGKRVARVHTGDPSIYGAIREQMDILAKDNIEFEVVPGVSSFVAAAAAIKKEYTLPSVSQTVILTRKAGRTPVPQGQELSELAKHKASMAIFLSVGMIEDVVKDLVPSYGEETPVAVVQKASWPDEKIIMGKLNNIAEKVKKEGITKTALILVGDFLGDEYELSKLYDKTFSHEYRSASK